MSSLDRSSPAHEVHAAARTPTRSIRAHTGMHRTQVAWLGTRVRIRAVGRLGFCRVHAVFGLVRRTRTMMMVSVGVAFSRGRALETGPSLGGLSGEGRIL